MNLDDLSAALAGEFRPEADDAADDAAPAPPVWPSPPSAHRQSTASSWRTAPLPANWKALRERVLFRDGRRCQGEGDGIGRVCGAEATDVDHVVPASQGGTDDLDNLQSLCRWHHRRKTGHEGGTAAAAANPSRVRRPERHPGLAPDDPRQSRDWTSTYRKTER